MALLLSARAHHAEIGIDTESLVEFEGRVIEFSWRNPHVYIVVNLAEDETQWTVQTSSTLTMTRVGWNRDSLSVGDYVTVRANPAQDGRSYGILRM
ncbi:MAG: DUF6152 family protein, partial [Gammaproteobacteria bacterium]|nr:DUF6152 family protein [Gammaproteobacteria bacterium]